MIYNDLKLIKGIINEEYADYFLYKNESELFARKIVDGKKISDVFSAFALDEIKHAQRIMQIFGITEKSRVRKIPPFKSLREVLRRHLLRELESVKLYNKLKLSAIDDNYKVKVIDDIIKEEERHYEIIRKYLLIITRI